MIAIMPFIMLAHVKWLMNDGDARDYATHYEPIWNHYEPNLHYTFVETSNPL